jgi:transposase
VTLFVDLTQRRTLFVTEGKGASTLHRFAEDLSEHGGDPQSIANVSCAMSPAFIKGVSQSLPDAQITFNKFHLLKIINDAVDKVHKEESKESIFLKNTLYIWLKNKKNLTAKQKEKLKELSLARLNLKSLKAYQIRQRFQEIYQAGTFDEFITYLK